MFKWQNISCLEITFYKEDCWFLLIWPSMIISCFVFSWPQLILSLLKKKDKKNLWSHHLIDVFRKPKPCKSIGPSSCLAMKGTMCLESCSSFGMFHHLLTLICVGCWWTGYVSLSIVWEDFIVLLHNRNKDICDMLLGWWKKYVKGHTF